MPKQQPKPDIQFAGDKAAGRAIASVRAAFNTALETRSLKAIADCLHPNAILVPGEDAPLINGRDAQIEAWTTIFNQAPDVHYVRSPARIEVNEDGLLAAESGRWTGGWTVEGMTVRYTGRYFAKWRLDGGDWRIEAETFVTMRRQSV